MARILVVDDDEQVRVMLRQMLSRMDHEVIDVDNGDDAILEYRKEPTDLIIMDLIMPDKEGIETITELRREFPDANIVAMSGGGRIGPNNYLELASKLGAKRTLTKPFDLNDIREAITAVLGDEV
ncbi:MAG: response regulator [Candidatus Sumerlaeia bacterium]